MFSWQWESFEEIFKSYAPVANGAFSGFVA